VARTRGSRRQVVASPSRGTPIRTLLANSSAWREAKGVRLAPPLAGGLPCRSSPSRSSRYPKTRHASPKPSSAEAIPASACATRSEPSSPTPTSPTCSPGVVSPGCRPGAWRWSPSCSSAKTCPTARPPRRCGRVSTGNTCSASSSPTPAPIPRPCASSAPACSQAAPRSAYCSGCWPLPGAGPAQGTWSAAHRCHRVLAAIRYAQPP
jgi:hypothetical protein